MPGRSIRNLQQRVLLTKMVIDTLRLYGAEYFKSDAFAMQLDDLMLFGAVFIGQAEGRPMNVSTLARYSGVPRPSAIRKLKSMVDAGKIVHDLDGSYCIPVARLNKPSALSVSAKVAAIVINTSRELSKLDT